MEVATSGTTTIHYTVCSRAPYALFNIGMHPCLTLPDSVISINDLQLDYVRETGYVNLRCSWVIGCPAELEPARYFRERPEDKDHPTAVEFPDRFMELFPGEELPEVVGTACCSQFAVSRKKIHEKGIEHYQRARQFLIDTTLGSETSGRIFEYVWHSKIAPIVLGIVNLNKFQAGVRSVLTYYLCSYVWKAAAKLPRRTRLLLQNIWILQHDQ